MGELEELIASRESSPRSERLISFARILLGRTLRERLLDVRPGGALPARPPVLYDFADERGLATTMAVRVIHSPPAGGMGVIELNVPDAPFLVDTVRAAVKGARRRRPPAPHPIVGF